MLAVPCGPSHVIGCTRRLAEMDPPPHGLLRPAAVLTGTVNFLPGGFDNYWGHARFTDSREREPSVAARQTRAGL